MHFVKDSNGYWYYDDKLSPGTLYYDFVNVPEGTDPTLVKKMKENMEKEDQDLENDDEMEDKRKQVMRRTLNMILIMMRMLKTLLKITQWWILVKC